LLCATEDGVFVFGGFGGESELKEVWHFDGSKWFALDCGPFTARSVGGCVLLNKRMIVIFGGEQSPSAEGHKGAGQFLNDVLVFEPTSKTWQEVKCTGDVPAPRGWVDCAVVGPNKILVVGGLTEDAARSSECFLLELE
jgi:N-acetylneuraminic acid mutarotase